MIASLFFVLALAMGGSTQQYSFSGDYQQLYYPEDYQEQFHAGGFPQQQFFQQQQFPEARPVAHPQAHHAPLPSVHQEPFYDYDVYGNPSAAFQTSPIANNNIHAAPAEPFVPIDSQYQAVDEYGQYAFGYSGGDSARTESRDVYGNVRGSYNYIDSEGNQQTQHYVADEYGFRVVGSNLPKGPEAQGVHIPTAIAAPSPQPVTDTPEVAAAKAAFVKAYNAAALAAAEAPDTPVDESA